MVTGIAVGEVQLDVPAARGNTLKLRSQRVGEFALSTELPIKAHCAIRRTFINFNKKLTQTDDWRSVARGVAGDGQSELTALESLG